MQFLPAHFFKSSRFHFDYGVEWYWKIYQYGLWNFYL